MPKKNQARKKFELRQNDLIFTKIFELYQVAKCSNTFKLYRLKESLSKNRLYFFFFFSHLLACKNYTIF